MLLRIPVNMMEEPSTNEPTYTIRPNFKDKFRPALVKEVLHKILVDKLHDKQYGSETELWSKEISDNIKEKLKDLSLQRYKYVVQVVIGEQRGEGVKMGSRCFWDMDTDNYTQALYMNETIFAVAVAYAIYYY